MPNIRIGFSSDFSLRNSVVGFGTTVGSATDRKLEVTGTLKGDLQFTGVATLRGYSGFIAQKQQVNKPSVIGFATVGLQTVSAATSTGYSYYETETGFVDLGGVQHGDDLYLNTLSEDLIVDDGQILNISSIDMVGETTIGEYDPHRHESHVCTGALESVSVQSNFSVPCGGIEARKENPIEGTVRFNDDLNTLEFYNGVEWRQFTVTGASGRGVFGGGGDPADTTLIEYLNLSSGGNTVRFGDLTDARTQLGGASSPIRGLFAGGDPGPSNSDVIEYITIASEGNGIDFGNLTAAGRLPAAASSSTRAIFIGVTASNVISYVEINTTGNAIDFGDLTNTSGQKGTAASSPTRFVYNSGSTTPKPQLIEYGTISSKGNTTTFGDLSYGGNDYRKPRATSNGIRGIFAGGYDNASPYPGLKQINYITMATTGNAQDFGELTTARQSATCTGSKIKTVHAGGETDASGSGTLLSSIDVIDYASSGNATDFGSLSSPNANGAGLSDCHGGLGGF